MSTRVSNKRLKDFHTAHNVYSSWQVAGIRTIMTETRWTDALCSYNIRINYMGRNSSLEFILPV